MCTVLYQSMINTHKVRTRITCKHVIIVEGGSRGGSRAMEGIGTRINPPSISNKVRVKELDIFRLALIFAPQAGISNMTITHKWSHSVLAKSGEVTLEHVWGSNVDGGSNREIVNHFRDIPSLRQCNRVVDHFEHE